MEWFHNLLPSVLFSSRSLYRSDNCLLYSNQEPVCKAITVKKGKEQQQQALRVGSGKNYIQVGSVPLDILKVCGAGHQPELEIEVESHMQLIETPTS